MADCAHNKKLIANMKEQKIEIFSKTTDSLLNNNQDETPVKVLEKIKSVESCSSVDVEAWDCSYMTYGAGDFLLASFIIAPLVVSVWRGTWGLMDIHHQFFPYAQSFLMGIIIHISFAVIRSYLLSRSKKEGTWSSPDSSAGKWLRERCVSRIYTYAFILACIMHWRGGWGLFDAVVDAALPDRQDPHRGVMIAALMIIFYVIMLCLRSSRNFLASPFFVFTDGKEATYMFTTRFKTNLSSRETTLYILDCVFSVAVVGSLVVFVWRGSWALLDIYLYPEDPTRSCLTSLAIGYAVVIATFSMQAPIRWAAARLHGAPRLLLADVYHMISFFATVNVWRAVWGLLDIYFFPDYPKLSNWSSHVISLTLLIVLNCSNSVIVRGVYIDAEEPAGECVVFPCHYLRLFFHKERTKKRHKQALATAALASARKSEEACVPLQMPEEKV